MATGSGSRELYGIRRSNTTIGNEEGETSGRLCFGVGECAAAAAEPEAPEVTVYRLRARILRGVSLGSRPGMFVERPLPNDAESVHHQEPPDRNFGTGCHPEWPSVNTRTPNDTKPQQVSFVYERVDILIASSAIDPERGRQSSRIRPRHRFQTLPDLEISRPARTIQAPGMLTSRELQQRR